MRCYFVNISNIQLLQKIREEDLIDSGRFEAFLKDAKNADLKSLALQLHGRDPLSKNLISLLDLYRRAQKKVPSLLEIFPALDKKGLEQCTDERVAAFRADYMGGGLGLLNLSGGMGVDDLAFSLHFKQVISLDPNERVNEMFRYNARKLGVSNVHRLDSTAEQYFNEGKLQPFDVIYADPDRRTGGNKGDMHAHSPDVFGLLHRILSCAQSFELKLSPLMDVGPIENIEKVHEIVCISLDGEMKEVWVRFKSVDRDHSSPLISAAMLKRNGERELLRSRDRLSLSEKAYRPNYLLIPDAALRHSRLSFNLALEQGAECISKTAQLFGIDHLPNKWFGKIYCCSMLTNFHPKQFKIYLRENEINQARLILMATEQRAPNLYRKFKLMEGGADYFLFFRIGAAEMVAHLKIAPPIIGQN